MKTKIFIGLVLSIFGLTFLVAGGVLAAKKARHKPPFILPIDEAQPPQEYVGLSPIMYEGAIQLDCEDIHPTGYFYVIQHEQFGSTYYDYQSSGSMGRMIAVSTAGERSMVFHETRGDYWVYPRYITYNCKDPASVWCGPIWVDGGPLINAGYGQMLLFHDGREVALYHTADRDAVIRFGASGNPCSCFFSTYFDLPDRHNFPYGSDPNGMWPKGCVVYDAVENRDYIHIVTTEPNPLMGGALTIAYQRCYLDGNNLACCSPNDSCYTIPPNVNMGTFSRPIAVIDTIMTTSAVVVSSLTGKVAIVYTKSRDNYDTQVNNDVVYIESDSNGNDWLSGTQWPPTKYNVTNYDPLLPERAYTDVAACYDYNDHLHIAWNSWNYDSAGGNSTFDANLMHWTDAYPLGFENATLVAPGYWDDGTVAPGGWNRTISKMSIAVQDPIYHPDSVYLFCIWTQFDTADLSAGGWTNGDIYGSVSHDSGRTWEPGTNLTNTQTPDCLPGACLSEHWSSMAENMYDGDLHIEYVCDRNAGGALRTDGWTDNPMMYLHVGLDGDHCTITYSLVDPPSFCDPPIKVSPDSPKQITLRVSGIYDLGGSYEITADHEKVTCISNCSGYLLPGESKYVELLISCAGQEDFINAIITIRYCIEFDERTILIPLHAVCSEDYYECMRDERTQIWKANDKCSLWVCCNTEQRVWDKRVLDPDGEIIQPIFSSGVIVATTADDDTVVGRQDYSDTRTYTRDTMIVIQGWMQPYFPAEQCSVQQIRCTKTFVCANNLEPPNHLKWWWISINKHILMLHGPNCPEWKQEQIIKYVWINYGSLPTWWPDQTPFADYEKIYLGVFSDVDAPFDTGCNGCNTAGYDSDRHIFWQHGYNAATHPEYEQYYVGLALTDRGGDVVAPLGTQNVLNEEYIYPQNSWGWKDGELYTLAATPGVNIHYPDSVDDRTVVLTADMVPAGSDPNTLDAEFILIEALIPTGLAALQSHIGDTRAQIIPELDSLGMFDRELYLCEDCNGDGW